MSFYDPYQWDSSWMNRPQEQGWALPGQGGFSGSTQGYQNQERLIQYGNQGENVRAIQQRLNDLGFNVGAVDGIFGPKTLAAVKAFQGLNGLTADGIVGPKTWRALLGAATPSPSGHLIQYGSQGEAARAVQQRLNQLGYHVGAVDGIFGPKTLASVKAFQSSHGLTVDGIVGPKTWHALFGTAATRGGFHHPEHWSENSVLQRGDSGIEVKNLQYILDVLAFYTMSGFATADGIFGPQTEQAVKKYQKGNRLNPDGIVGSKTWSSFTQFVEKKSATTYGLGGFMGLRIQWQYDSTSDRSPCTATVWGNGTTVTDQYRLYPY